MLDKPVADKLQKKGPLMSVVFSRLSMMVFWVVTPCGLTGRYSTRDQTVRFVYVTNFRVKRKTHILSKDITDIETETASYKVLPLENNVHGMDSFYFLICYPSLPYDPLAFYL
jgi:hypothetical protein